jgi:type IV secretory pathway VirB10-like protein
LPEQVAKLSKARHLDAESIAEVKTRITSRPSTILRGPEKGSKTPPPARPPLPPTSSHRIRDPFPLPSPENNQEEEEHSPTPRRRRHDALEYSEDDRPELEVKKTCRLTYPSDSQIVLVEKENKQPTDKPKVFSGKITDNVRFWHKLVNTYFWYERKKFTIDADKID